MDNHALEIDFTEQIRQLEADKKAGYPPNCNEGYEAKDGKCVKIIEDSAKESSPDKDKDKDKKKGGKSDDKKDGDKKDGDKKGGDNLPPWMKKKKKGDAKDYPGKSVKRREDGVPKKKMKKRACKPGEYRDKSGDIKKTKGNNHGNA